MNEDEFRSFLRGITQPLHDLKGLKDVDQAELLKTIENTIKQNDLSSSQFQRFFKQLAKSIEYFTEYAQAQIFEAIEKYISSDLVFVLSSLAKNSETLCEIVIAEHIPRLTKEQFTDIINTEQIYPIFKSTIENNQEFQTERFFDRFLGLASQAYCIDFLIFLNDTNPELSVRSASKLNEAQLKHLQALFSLADQRIARECLHKFSEFGYLLYEDALLCCAAIAESKKEYTFNPVVVTTEEFASFIKLIHENRNSVAGETIRFIVTGRHWLCGQLEYDENGKLNVLILDPKGGYTPYIKYLDKAIKATDTQAEVFYAHEQKQHSAAGCSIFALMDCRYLFTCEKFLPKEYNGLFDFLRKNTVDDATDHTQEYNDPSANLPTQSSLPLFLLKGMQSRQLKTISRARKEESRLPINKKSQHNEEEASIVIQEYFNYDANAKTERNTHLETKLHKMREHCFEFLLAHPSTQEILDLLEPYTISFFEAKLTEKSHNKLQ